MPRGGVKLFLFGRLMGGLLVFRILLQVCSIFVRECLSRTYTRDLSFFGARPIKTHSGGLMSTESSSLCWITSRVVHHSIFQQGRCRPRSTLSPFEGPLGLPCVARGDHSRFFSRAGRLYKIVAAFSVSRGKLSYSDNSLSGASDATPWDFFSSDTTMETSSSAATPLRALVDATMFFV